MAKTVSIGGKNYKANSKAAKAAVSAGGKVSTKASDVRRNADVSLAATKARSASDPLTVAENAGLSIPERIAPGGVDAALGGAPKPPQAPTTAVAPSTAQIPSATPTRVPGGVQAPIATPAAAPTPTQNKYQAALAQVQQGSPAAPSDAGQARLGVTGALEAQGQKGNAVAVDSLYAENPELKALTKMAADYFSPSNQKKSLLDDYKKLRRQSGLDDINEEIIDAETIIDGTEDDIRNEIQMAGGMGTESQIQAMTLARNKSLLKRYNQLVAMKENATTELNMMMNLTAQDRQMAEQRFSTAMNLQMGLANFRQQALQNTRQQYQWMAQIMGADGLYNSLSKDPRQLAAAEKILGLSAGGLQKVAASAAEAKAFERSVQEQQLAISRGNLAVSQGNLALSRAQFEWEKNKPIEQSATQLVAQGFADRTNNADQIITGLGSKFTGALSGLGSLLPSRFQTSNRQSYEQAQRNFINSVLRRESGAAIAESEFESARKQYFPQPGDSATVVAQKGANRQDVINNLYQQAGTSRPVQGGEIFLTP